MNEPTDHAASLGLRAKGAVSVVTLFLSGLTAGAAWWSGYNPFLWGLLGIVGWWSILCLILTNGMAARDGQEGGR